MKKKDEDEFTVFIKEHKRRIYKLCYLYRSDSMGPDDLYQEVLINLWRCWGSFAGRSAMSTYVHRITLNTAFTFLRKKYREVPTCVLGEPDDLPLDEQAEDPHEDMLCELRRRISCLGETDRKIVSMYADGKSCREIAEIMKMSLTNTSTRLSRIKEKLRRL
ncbi:MAG: RNA polymerase sigma factor [Flavobacteriales bacterium]|nr:RNA polymerase sigma factor [Flavobacteriales bacterium]PWM09534.1 MAG: RNA polymerase subunit sigma-70 [Flavobacteriales bacterium]